MIVLNLPYPPSVNNYWIASGHRRFISKRGVEFKNAVMAYCIDLRTPNFGKQAVWVEIVLHPRNKRLQDIDNVLKPILDSLIGIVYDDDVQVQSLQITRGQAIKNGGCRVMIDVYPPSSGESSLTENR
jgi:crossover junction endodeoxyribonuclease RusA